MNWYLDLSRFLLQAAVAGSILLFLAWIVLCLSRCQPALRVRVIECTLAGCLLVPVVSQLPFLPRFCTGLIDRNENASSSVVPEGISDSRLNAERLRSEKFRLPLHAELGVESPAAPPLNSPESTAVRSISKTLESPPKPPVKDAVPFWVITSIIVAFAWIGACLLLSFRWLQGWFALRRMMKNSLPASPHILNVLHELAGGRSRNVRVVMSREIEHPLTFGWFRPVIVVPASSCEAANETELRFGLAHEWSHVEGQDIRRWHLASLVRFLFFWQPLFWKLRDQLRLSQDVLADALAAEQSPEPEDYAEYLVRVARRAHGLPTEVALGMADRPSQLYRRVTMLIHDPSRPRRHCSRLWSLAVLGLTLVSIAVVSTLRLDAEETPKKEPPAKETESEKVEKKAEPPAKGETLTYTGVVSSRGDRKPIEGATVTVRRSTSGSVSRNEKADELLAETKHKTDKEGKYTFTIPPEQSSKYTLYIELDVEAPGYAPQTGFGYSLTMIRQNEMTGERPFFESVQLRPAKEVTGTIETPGGKPAKGVRVLTYSTKPGGPFNEDGEHDYGSFAETFTDEKGKFALWIVTPGEMVMWILPKDHSPSTHAPKKDQRGDLGKFVLQEGVRLKGKAVDTDGKPIAGIYVGAENAVPNEALNGLAVADQINRGAMTDEKGEFELLPLPVGKYRLKATDYSYEPSVSSRGRTGKIALEHVFLSQLVSIKEGERPDPIEVRAHPHAVVEVQFKNSKGEPSGGHAPHFVGRLDGEWWHSEMKLNKGGRAILKVPHGIEGGQLDFIENEHNSVRFRKSKDDPLTHGYSLQLGTIDRDMKGIEAIRYTAPTLLVTVKSKGGEKLDPKAIGLIGWYMDVKEMRSIRFSTKGRPSEMNFQRQEDGKFRTSQMLPGEDMLVTAFLDGYKDAELKVKLDEGATKEVEIVLEKK
jgi:beta-lactamase regulating signal transducer with metallopeptidase domain